MQPTAINRIITKVRCLFQSSNEVSFKCGREKGNSICFQRQPAKLFR